MTAAVRLTSVTLLIIVTITLQVSIFSHFAIDGVVPDLALLVVIAAALVRGPDYAALVGFAAGLVLDLAPPADHTAGRWALSLCLVGYLTGLVRGDGETNAVGTVVTVAAGAFIGTSIFALTGLVLRDPGVSAVRRDADAACHPARADPVPAARAGRALVVEARCSRPVPGCA